MKGRNEFVHCAVSAFTLKAAIGARGFIPHAVPNAYRVTYKTSLHGGVGGPGTRQVRRVGAPLAAAAAALPFARFPRCLP